MMTNTEHAIDLIKADRKLNGQQIELMIQLGKAIHEIEVEHKYKGTMASINHLATECRKQGVAVSCIYLEACYKLTQRVEPDQLAIIRKHQITKQDIIALMDMPARTMHAQLMTIDKGDLKARINNQGRKTFGLGKSDKNMLARKIERKTNVDSANNTDMVRIAIMGEIDEEAILNVLKNLCSRLGVERFGRLAEQARRETGAK
jgi:hypothetical protein